MAADWKKIKAEYIRGGTSYRKLASKHGVSLSALTRRASSEKWADLRIQSEYKASIKIADKIASQEAERAVDLADIAMELAKKIRDGIDDGRFVVDASSARDASIALKNLRDLAGKKAEQDLEEQRARIEKLRKEAQADEENKEIRVVISDDLKEYAE